MKKQIFFTLLFIGYSSLAIACPTAQSVHTEMFKELTDALAQKIAVAAGFPGPRNAYFSKWELSLTEDRHGCNYQLGGENGPMFFSIEKPN